MNKTSFTKIILIAALALFLPVSVWAAGTVTVTSADDVPLSSGGKLLKLTATWTADAAAATVPTTTLNFGTPCYIVRAVTDPGATAPTTLYDIVVNDSDGVDVMGGVLANRSATASEQAVPSIGGAYGAVIVSGPLSFVLSNNSVNSAVGTTSLYCIVAE